MIDIFLEDENGIQLDEVADAEDLLGRLLPAPDDESFACLRFVDPYGDTTFNRRQSEILIRELQRIRTKAIASGEWELLDQIEKLAQRCQSGPHLYIKFCGD